MSGSKFAGLAAARKRDVEPEEETPAVTTNPTRQETGEARSRPGRPAGKRSDPSCVQVTAYIKRDTHRAVKIALLQENEDREFSELVEELLADWLKSRT